MAGSEQDHGIHLMSVVSMTMRLECFLAVVLAFGMVESLYDVQELQISIGIVTSRSGNVGEVYSYTLTFSPRKDVLITTYFNWTTVDPRDPFVSIKKLLISSSCNADLSIWSVEWELANFLMLPLELYNGRTLLWYGGIVRKLDNTDYPRSQKVQLLDDFSKRVSLQTSRPTVGSSLSSDFEALKNHYGRVLNALLHSLQWNHFVLVTDNSTARHINNLLSLVMEKKHKITQLQVYEERGEKHIHEGIRNAYYMQKNGQVHFLLFCELDCVFQVVMEAQRFDSAMGGKTALSYMSRWLIVTLPEHRDKIEGLLTELNNIAVLTAASSTKSQLDQKYISDLVQDVIFEVFTVSNLSRTSPDVESHQDKYLNTTIETLIASITREDRSHPCVTCPMFEIQTALWKRDGRRFSPVGRYVLSEGLLLHSGGVFPNKNFGFNNQTLNIATNPWPLFVVKDEDAGEFEGLCMDLLLELSMKMNFSYMLYEPADGDWGVRRSDGHWTGLVGELEFRRANITIAPLAITADREEVVDFAFPFYYDYNGVLIKKPDASELKWRTLVDIFTYPVYIGIAVSLPVMTLLVYLSERFNPFYRAYTTEELGAYPGFHNFQDALWYMYGALLTQGGVFLPKSQTGRTLLSFWWLYSIIMVASYSGNLIASLTVTTDRLPFNSLKEMIGQKDYQWGTTSGTYLNLLFEVLESEDSNLTEYRKIWEGMKFFPESMSDSHEAHIEMVKKGGYAYMNDKSGMVKWVSKECDLVLIKEEFFPMTYGIGLPNDSPYKDMFSHQMLKIVESGLMHIWKQKWWPKRNFCSEPVKAVAKRIELVDVQSAFYILFIGGVLGSVVILIENAWKKYLDSKGTKHDKSNVEHISTSTFPVQVTDQTL